MQMEREPVVSVAMAMRNAERTVATALESVLEQSFCDWELLLVDDGSSDGSLEVIGRFSDERIRVLADGERRGLGARLNQVVELARGRYVARMDADDIAYPERFERQVAFLEAERDVDLLGTGALVFDDAGEVHGVYPVRRDHASICARPLGGFYLPHPTWMGRREWFRRYLYDASAWRAQDQDLLLRSYSGSRFASLPVTLLGYRQERLSLRNVLLGRMYFTRAVLRYAWLPGQRLRVLAALLGQMAKAGVDIGAIITGFGGPLLRRRVEPASSEQLEEWRGLWGRIHGEVARRCAG